MKRLALATETHERETQRGLDLEARGESSAWALLRKAGCQLTVRSL